MQKVIQLDFWSRTKNPTPSVVRNPTPPKNLRLRNRDGSKQFGIFLFFYNLLTLAKNLNDRS